MASRTLLTLSLSALILFNTFCYATLAKDSSPAKADDDEDLSFLEEDDAASSQPDPYHYSGEEYRDFENYDDLEEETSDSGNHDAHSLPVVDEKDVVVLKESNFSDFIAENRYVMVEFYAPWCGHCQALAPEYAAAATELKGEAVLAKVDAMEESELAQKYEIQGFPTVYFFIDGVHKDYPGQRTKDAIVTWVKKKTGPGIYNLTTIKEAEHTLATDSKLVLGFLDNLVVFPQFNSDLQLYLLFD
ncbi:protein disulfide-isomerase [Sarracenia purpurea var. burkii]